MNLQKINRKIFDLAIHAPVDYVFQKVMEGLNISVEDKIYEEPVLFSIHSLQNDGVKQENIPTKKIKKEKHQLVMAENSITSATTDAIEKAETKTFDNFRKKCPSLTSETISTKECSKEDTNTDTVEEEKHETNSTNNLLDHADGKKYAYKTESE